MPLFIISKQSVDKLSLFSWFPKILSLFLRWVFPPCTFYECIATKLDRPHYNQQSCLDWKHQFCLIVSQREAPSLNKWTLSTLHRKLLRVYCSVWDIRDVITWLFAWHSWLVSFQISRRWAYCSAFKYSSSACCSSFSMLQNPSTFPSTVCLDLLWSDFMYVIYSQVHKYWDIDTILTFLALYTTTMDFKLNEQDVL